MIEYLKAAKMCEVGGLSVCPIGVLACILLCLVRGVRLWCFLQKVKKNKIISASSLFIVMIPQRFTSEKAQIGGGVRQRGTISKWSSWRLC